MTLIELLAALALLSSLVAVATTWTVHVATTERSLSDDVRWRTAAHATLDRIGEDILRLEPPEDDTEPVRWQYGTLELATRVPISDRAGVRYRLDETTGTLTRDDGTDRVLLRAVRSWTVTVLPESPWIQVELVHTDGVAVERTFRTQTHQSSTPSEEDA